ncbi:MAG: DUF4838 domain-containing protein [Lentisphaeria bacterium]|nr:DUF4838 domain-containing protein [Lentisphaeria bacterium]
MKFFTLFLLVLAGVMLPAGEFARIHNLRIVLPEEPSEIEKFAAGELKEHLSRTFTAPAQLNGKTPDRINLFVGRGNEACKSGFSGDHAEAVKESKFGIYRNNNDFLFIGFDTAKGNVYAANDSCGTLLAVEYFAQKYLQSKFFLPGKDGVKYVLNPLLNFTAASDVPQASYEVRGFQSGAKDVDRKDFMLFYRRRLGQVPRWSTRNCNYMFINKWNKRFKNKPEMFGLFGKKRINTKYPYHFPCPSHPDTIPQIVKDVTGELKKNPDIYGIRFFCDAPVKNCECEKCVNSPAGKLVTAGDRSEFVFAFFCKFAHEIKKVKPDLIFHLQTKSSHFQPPRTEKLPGDTVIAVLSGHFEAPDYNILRNRCKLWENAGAKVVLYSYPRAPEMKTFPIMNPHRIADHFKKMQGFALGATMSEGRGRIPYSFSALNTYIHSAVMFDCSVNVDKLIAEFCSLAAPEAAAELQEFYKAMEKLLENAGFREDPLLNCYLAFRLKEPRKLLDKAVAKSPENAFLQSLSREFAVFEKTAESVSPGINSMEEYQKAMKKLKAKQKPVKLSAAGVDLELKAFAIFRDFQSTQVRLSGNADVLKLQFVCNENMMDKLRTVCKENHAGSIWNDDAVEIFISSYRKSAPYLHLGVNALGSYRLLAVGADRNVRDVTDMAITTGAVREKDRWLLEVDIPMNEVRKFVVNDRIHLGIYRHRPARGADKTQTSGVQNPKGGLFSSLTGRFVVEF